MEQHHLDVLQQLYQLYQTRCDRNDCSRTVSNFNSSIIDDIAEILSVSPKEVLESLQYLESLGYTKIWMVGGFELTKQGIRAGERFFQ